MHYYEFNIGDYRRRTTHLTPIEHYIYRTLLDWYFLDEKPLKADMDYLLRILGLPKRNKEQVQNVLNDFFIEVDGFYHNKRVDEMLQGYHANRENGKKGGRPKKSDDNPSKNDVQTDDNPSESDTKPNENPNKTQIKPNEKAIINQEPSTINQDIHISTPHMQTGEQVDDVQELLNLWTIPLKQVNDFIQMSALAPMTEIEFNQLKPAFVGYYADDIRNGISSGKLLSKLVSWLKREKLDNDIRQAKYAKKPTTATPNIVNQNHEQRHVNTAWGEPDIKPLDPNQTVTIPEGWD